MRRFFTTLMAMVLVGPSIAVAGPYMGLGIGIARTESSLAKLDLAPTLDTDVAVIGTDPDFSSSDVNFSALVGWMFGPHFGVEVGYTDFGTPTQVTELPQVCTQGFGCQTREWTAQAKLDGMHAFLVGELPLSKTINGYAKVGAVHWNGKFSGFERARGFVGDPGQIGPGNDPVNYSDSGTDLAAGLGLRLETASPFSIRAEVAYYDISRMNLVIVAQLLGVYAF